MPTLKSMAEAKEEADKNEQLKKRAAKQAAKSLAVPTEIKTVECTVLPAGDGKISMGQHVPGLGEAHYEEGETFTAPLPNALALYERHYVNFEGAKEALAELRHARKAAEMEAVAEAVAFRNLIAQKEAEIGARL